jgi:hypothetical protein
MDSSRQAKIQLLSRINRVRAATPDFIKALSQAIKQPVDVSALVPAEESDSLWEVFRLGYRSSQSSDAISYRKFFPGNKKGDVLQLAACVADHITDENVFFLTKLGVDYEAIRVNSSALLKQAEAVINIDGDSITVLSTDQSQGLLIDSNEDDPVQSYEVTAWGDRWPQLILGCDYE